MKKIGIVTMSLDKWEITEIVKEISSRGFQTEIITNQNFVVDCTSLKGSNMQYHSVLGRVERPILSQGLSILKALESGGEHVINNAESIYYGQNKAYSSMIFSRENIPHPKTVFGFSKESLVDQIEKMKFPLVFKPWIGGRGAGVVKADSYNIALEFIEIILNSNQPVYIQEFISIPNKAVINDLRVFVVGNNVIGAYSREAKASEWKTNLSTGGVGKKFVINPCIESIAINATKSIGADIAGVDVIEGEDGYKVLEVNVCPMFKGFYEVTGINPSESIANILCEKNGTQEH